MSTNAPFAAIRGGLFGLLLAAASAVGQVPGSPLAVRSIAEVETRSMVAGREVVKLIPADRVVPGDRVIYTLEVRNTGATALDSPIVTHPVPEHMRYIADSAVGPGAEVGVHAGTISGCAGLPARGAVPVAMPSLRGRPASVISAMLQRPAEIDSRAWPTAT